MELGIGLIGVGREVCCSGDEDGHDRPLEKEEEMSDSGPDSSSKQREAGKKAGPGP